MTTPYDEKREMLKTMVNECVDFTYENLMNRHVSGYADMTKDYAINIYKKLIDVLNEI